MKEILLIFTTFPIFLFSIKKNDRKKTEKISVTGKYCYFSEDSMFSIMLEVKPDSAFIYNEGNDLSVLHSQGTWRLIKDKLQLNSNLNSDRIPIQITERRVDTIKDYIQWRWVNNLKNDIMNATLAFNGDTTHLCEPFTGSNCNYRIGNVDSILVRFGNYAHSGWHKIKNKKANVIQVTALVDDLLEKYRFLSNQDFLIQGSCIMSTKNESIILKKCD